MSKVVLMVFTTVAEKFAKREELISKFPKCKYSDFAVETDDTVYKFQVINMDPVFNIVKSLSEMKITMNYDEIQMDNVVKGIKTLFQNVVRLCGGVEAVKKAEDEEKPATSKVEIPVTGGPVNTPNKEIPKELQSSAGIPMTDEQKKKLNIGNGPVNKQPEAK